MDTYTAPSGYFNAAVQSRARGRRQPVVESLHFSAYDRRSQVGLFIIFVDLGSGDIGTQIGTADFCIYFDYYL